jgi:hypothetical protein
MLFFTVAMTLPGLRISFFIREICLVGPHFSGCATYRAGDNHLGIRRTWNWLFIKDTKDMLILVDFVERNLSSDDPANDAISIVSLSNIAEIC